MKPIVLIHGYGGESKSAREPSIRKIYGHLPERLTDHYGPGRVVDVDISRWVSLEDGLNLEDIARALEKALTSDEQSHLLRSGFHCIIHSTGALVVRKWVQMFDRRPSPLDRLIYLAGAQFGSGLAHVGKGQLAEWFRKIERGAEPGRQVLAALEFGSPATIDLHLWFLRPENRMESGFGIREFAVIGTQAAAEWMPIPIRYVKEDGSDGVVRVAASNPNFQWISIKAKDEAKRLDWQTVEKFSDNRDSVHELYRQVDHSLPGAGGRDLVPFAIPFECAHSGKESGIVVGRKPADQVLKLITHAIDLPAAGYPQVAIDFYDAETGKTYEQAKDAMAPPRWLEWLTNPQGQYDGHSQVIVRMRDQDGRPVENYDVFFNNLGTGLPMRELIEHSHVNGNHKNIITFYLRTLAWDKEEKDWIRRVPQVEGIALDISAKEPETDQIKYLPMRYLVTGPNLTEWITPHRTTILDVELLRLPSPGVFTVIDA